MAASAEPPPHNHHRRHPLPNFFHSATSAVLSLLPNPRTSSAPPTTSPSSSTSSPPPHVCIPFNFVDSSFPLGRQSIIRSPLEPAQPDSVSSKSATVKGLSSAEPNSGFPSTVRISGLNSDGKGGGPAFVGQVFSMCDLSGSGLMAVSTCIDLPFINERTPEWLKKIFSSVTNKDKNGPVFRFFMDLGDAVSYVKKLNIPSGVVGACRLDLAYEQFKESPGEFEFVPNQKQVKAAKQLLKTMPQSDGKTSVDGVPIFSAHNLDIAIATSDGIKWYTPYFFNKSMLDGIIEDSVDQHFHSLIQSRHMQRRRDVVDDNFAEEVMEEMADSLMDPPEVDEMMDEMGNVGIPLSVISKAAEMELLYAVDKVLLGNRWLRKATGIQPRFPYVVDSFERRSARSLQKASKTTSLTDVSQAGSSDSEVIQPENTPQASSYEERPDLRLPFGDWFGLQSKQKPTTGAQETRMKDSSKQSVQQKPVDNPLLPKITMVGISTGDTGKVSKASLKKTMETLRKELELSDEGKSSSGDNGDDDFKIADRDPLFVANVGDYSRWLRRGMS
ncbi:hypothetical protein LINPERPRIM_LOCUS11945 [Linum perenne]